MAASYPDSIKSFTAKVDDVDTIAAAHVNDLQDEVAAIQTTLGADLANVLLRGPYVINTYIVDTSDGAKWLRIPTRGYSIYLPNGANDKIVATNKILTTNNGSNYWTVTSWLTDTAFANPTQVHNFNTSLDTVNVWTPHDAVPSVNTATYDDGLLIGYTKSGSPGALCLSLSLVYYLVIP